MLIGTHDSCSYKVNPGINYWNSDSIYSKLSKLSSNSLLGGLATSYIKRITLCQRYDVYDQLKLGVRVFDIRVSFYNQRYTTNHTFFCEYLDVICRHVCAFFNNNPHALPITLLIKPDWETRHTMQLRDIDFIKYLNKYFAPYSTYVNIYYKPFNETTLKNQKIVKNLNSFRFVWLNQDNLDDFLSIFNELANTDLTNSVFLFTLTPNSDISSIKDFFKLTRADVKEFAEELNPRAYDLLTTLKQKNNLPKFVLFDFIDSNLISKLNTLN